jgi:hypothetical protein
VGHTVPAAAQHELGFVDLRQDRLSSTLASMTSRCARPPEAIGRAQADHQMW